MAVELLLSKLAGVLTELNSEGVAVELKFGSVFTDMGYVLQNEDGSWRSCPKVGPAPEWWDIYGRYDTEDA